MVPTPKVSCVGPEPTFAIFHRVINGWENTAELNSNKQIVLKIRCRNFILPLDLVKGVNQIYAEIVEFTKVGINTALGRMRYGLLNLRKMMDEKRLVL